MLSGLASWLKSDKDITLSMEDLPCTRHCGFTVFSLQWRMKAREVQSLVQGHPMGFKPTSFLFQSLRPSPLCTPVLKLVCECDAQDCARVPFWLSSAARGLCAT